MNKQAKIALALLAAALFLSAAFLLRPKQAAVIAVIKQDGAVIEQIDLSKIEGVLTFPVDGENRCWNTVVAEKGRIRVESASCPDQICVNQGWITDDAVPIVCLPNKLVIEISGGEGELDAVTG